MREGLEEGLETATVALSVTFLAPGKIGEELVVWGVTAALLDCVLDVAGLARPWDVELTRPLPAYLLAPYSL